MMHAKLATTVIIPLMLAACQPASLEAAATERAIEIVEESIPGVGQVALTDVVIGADDGDVLSVCATASAANLPPRRIIADVEFGKLRDDTIMRLDELTGRVPEECTAAGMDRVLKARTELRERWLAGL